MEGKNAGRIEISKNRVDREDLAFNIDFHSDIDSLEEIEAKLMKLLEFVEFPAFPEP